MNIPRWLRKIFMSRSDFDFWDRNKDIKNPFEKSIIVAWETPEKADFSDLKWTDSSVVDDFDHPICSNPNAVINILVEDN